MNAPPNPRDRYRSSSPRAVAQFVPRLTKAAFAKRGFATARLAIDWPEIVGPALADNTLPEKLTGADRPEGGVLTIKVRPAAALEVQHLTPQLIERINQIFGFRAVGRLRLQQGVVPMRPKPKPAPPPLDPVESQKLAAQLSGVTDEGLNAALASLGRSLRAPRP
jgi:hypothetical protein